MSIDEHILPFVKNWKEIPAVRVQQEYHANLQDGMQKEIISMDVIIDEETNSDENVDSSDNSSHKTNTEEEMSQGILRKPLRRSTQTRTEPSWFKINAMPKTTTEDEYFVKEALDGDVKEA